MSVRNFISKISNFLDHQIDFTIFDRITLYVTVLGCAVLYLHLMFEVL